MKKLLRDLYYRLPVATYPYKPYMLRYKCIFIHIPKTAGTSILAALGHTFGRSHDEWYLYQYANPYRFDRYFKFAVIRQPEDRFRSTISYLLDGGNQSQEDMTPKNFIINASDREQGDYTTILEPSTLFNYRIFRPQHTFIFDQDGNAKVDKCINLDDLSAAWPGVATFLGAGIDLPRRNQSQIKDDKKITFNDETLEMLRHVYKKDFELLFSGVN